MKCKKCKGHGFIGGSFLWHLCYCCDGLGQVTLIKYLFRFIFFEDGPSTTWKGWINQNPESTKEADRARERRNELAARRG